MRRIIGSAAALVGLLLAAAPVPQGGETGRTSGVTVRASRAPRSTTPPRGPSRRVRRCGRAAPSFGTRWSSFPPAPSWSPAEPRIPRSSIPRAGTSIRSRGRWMGRGCSRPPRSSPRERCWSSAATTTGSGPRHRRGSSGAESDACGSPGAAGRRPLPGTAGYGLFVRTTALRPQPDGDRSPTPRPGESRMLQSAVAREDGTSESWTEGGRAGARDSGPIHRGRARKMRCGPGRVVARFPPPRAAPD